MQLFGFIKSTHSYTVISDPVCFYDNRAVTVCSLNGHYDASMLRLQPFNSELLFNRDFEF